MSKRTVTGLPADPNDPEDFDVSAEAVEQALEERQRRRAALTRHSEEHAVRHARPEAD